MVAFIAAWDSFIRDEFIVRYWFIEPTVRELTCRVADQKDANVVGRKVIRQDISSLLALTRLSIIHVECPTAVFETVDLNRKSSISDDVSAKNDQKLPTCSSSCSCVASCGNHNNHVAIVRTDFVGYISSSLIR
eukprot:scaffold23479_cov143-Cylindrotheca_fusiformis.AAC.23